MIADLVQDATNLRICKEFNKLNPSDWAQLRKRCYYNWLL